MLYFIADLGPTMPCHPLYDRGYTWITTTNDQETESILNALVIAGFNGIRLPMWPESDQVLGPDPSNESRDINRSFCDQLNKDWVKKIKSAGSDASYKDFFIYFSPALDNRALQTGLDQNRYASWVLSYTSSDYSPDFLSPFSSNDTTLRNQRFSDTSLLSDEETMWELDTVVTLKQKQQWKDLRPKPRLIGPDKATVSHTLNVLNSYSERATWIRPNY